VHTIRTWGIPDLVRACNTKEKKKNERTFERAAYVSYFKDDVAKLSAMLNRDFTTAWSMQKTDV
jgi:hypothetical protein